ncbi:tetratricopeptide repeat protein [Sulfurimonas sp. C5]|uniref:tetratricopeptide repeat protein n=1 Tax=Sulfurimonas sp. C5 TaxID=3036947 RepID=UPI002458AB5C|nr:tetratricopeptide repeat protein [Sulfurimonas sp. C5]MDH4944429.1 tetratricopeptide repeat protein [Sulfurimonas sp. C5]
MSDILSSHPWLACQLGQKELENLVKKIEEFELDQQKFVNWFSNFKDPKEYELALKLFDLIDFRNSKRLIDTIKTYKTQIDQCKYELDKKNIILVSSDENTDSSNRFIYDLAKEWKIHENNVFKASELKEDILKDSSNFFIFFNDTHGTGNQFVTEFKDIIESIDEKNCAIICITITDIALKRFQEEFSDIAFIQPNFQSTKNIQKHHAEQKLTQEELDLIKKLGEKVYPSHPLGYKESSLLIAYSHQCPNNTLPIIWANGENNEVKAKAYPWHPLFEYKKIKKEIARSQEVDEKNLTALPPRNPDFIGRVDELKAIQENLQSNKLIYIVNGIGGVGKSEVSYEYFHKHKDEYKKVAFIELSNEELSLEDIFLINFKEMFQLNSFDAIIRRLQEYPERNLFLIDNLERIEDFEKLKALNTNFDMLITSRQTDIDTNHQLNLETLLREDARELFLSIYKTDEDIEDILDYLDNHPLFINLMAKSLVRKYITLNELRDDIKNNTIAKIQSKDRQTFDEHLKKIFNKQFENEKDKELKLLLQKLSIFPSVEISFEIYDKLLEVERTQLQQLVDKGWLIHKDGQYKLHQIIKTFILTSYPPEYEEIIPIFENVANYIDPYDSTLVINLLTHYISIIESFLSFYKNQKDGYIAGLLDSLTYLYFGVADYEIALNIQNNAKEIRESSQNSDELSIAKSYNLLGVILNEQGQYEEALDWIERALVIQEKILEIDHPDKIVTYNNIASVYINKKDYKKALEWYDKALEIEKKLVEINPLDIVITYNGFALVYSQRTKYKEALEWYDKALEIEEKMLEANHPNIAVTYNNIATTYSSKGSDEDALEWHGKALDIKEKVLGINHPSTATTYNNIATVYSSKRKYLEALEWYLKALKIREKILGNNHIDTISTYQNIAFVYKKQKFCKKALEYFKKALNACEQTDYSRDKILQINRSIKDIEKLQKQENKAKFKDKGRFCQE